jgi:hypothetical protein
MAAAKGGLRILLVWVRPRRNAQTLFDHARSFSRFSRHAVHTWENVESMAGSLPRDSLDSFDALVIHYSNYLLDDRHFDASRRERIRNYRGLKVLFLQDEYRRVEGMRSAIRDLGIDVLFTCVPRSEWSAVYPRDSLPGVTLVETLTGYVPQAWLDLTVPPVAARPVDVGYRARRVPYWLGGLGAEKWRLGEDFVRLASGSGLRLDVCVEEGGRLYGGAWRRFLESCRTVLGSESGASVFDFTGEIQAQVESHLQRQPSASFAEVQSRFLAQHEGRIRLNQISPRCFEAAALRTGMVLLEGEYSGILAPGRHYIPLKKDFGNLRQVVETIRDTMAIQRMVDCCYEEIARSEEYSYRRFVARFDDIVEIEIARRGTRRAASGSPARSIGYAASSSVLLLAAWVRAGLSAVLPSPVKRRVSALLGRSA